MSVQKYKIVATATSNIEWAKISLEGKNVYLKPNAKLTEFKNTNKEIQVEGMLNIFCKCKGDVGIKVRYVVTNLKSNKDVLDKTITIGNDPQMPRLGRWSGDKDPE